MINICVFEDSNYKALFPLTYSRPSYALKVGGYSLKEKIDRFFSKVNVTLHCRDYLLKVTQEQFPNNAVNKITGGSPCLFINGRTIMDGNIYKEIMTHPQDHSFALTYRGNIVAIYLKELYINDMISLLSKLSSSEEILQFFREKCVCKELEIVSILTHTWDILQFQNKGIRTDFRLKNTAGIIKGNITPNTTLYNEDNMVIDANTNIMDFVVIDARQGPVIIESDVTIHPFSHLEGPLFIGKGSQILGAKISHSVIGYECKIGGEVKQSLFYNYSNKAHEGYIGNSVIGEWVNLGAGTTTSNLNLNYQEVSVSYNNERIQTNTQFLGSIIGDHVKTGIGTLLNTGTHIGFGSAIYGGGMPQEKEIPALRWGKPGEYQAHDLDHFLKTMAIVMKRRKRKPSDAFIALVNLLHEHEHSEALTSI